MKYIIPIYLTNAIIGIYQIKGRNFIKRTEVKINLQIIKGFSVKDIIENRSERFFKKVPKKNDEVLKIEKLELISQHGYGINE